MLLCLEICERILSEKVTVIDIIQSTCGSSFSYSGAVFWAQNYFSNPLTVFELPLKVIRRRFPPYYEIMSENAANLV